MRQDTVTLRDANGALQTMPALVTDHLALVMAGMQTPEGAVAPGLMLAHRPSGGGMLPVPSLAIGERVCTRLEDMAARELAQMPQDLPPEDAMWLIATVTWVMADEMRKAARAQEGAMAGARTGVA